MNLKDIQEETIVRIDVRGVSVPLYASALAPEGACEVFYMLYDDGWVAEEPGWKVNPLYPVSDMYWARKELREAERRHYRAVGALYGSEAILRVSYHESMRAVDYHLKCRPQTDDDVIALARKIQDDHVTAMKFVQGGTV